MRSESRAALRVGRDILRLSRRGDDPAAYVEGQRRIGGALQQLGRLVPAQRHFERGLARFAPAQEPVRERAFTVEPYSTLLAHLFPNLLLLGYPDRARTRRAEAIELTRRAAHPPDAGVDPASGRRCRPFSCGTAPGSGGGWTSSWR